MSIWAALGLGFAGSLFGIALARLFEHLRRPRRIFPAISPPSILRVVALGATS